MRSRRHRTVHLGCCLSVQPDGPKIHDSLGPVLDDAAIRTDQIPLNHSLSIDISSTNSVLTPNFSAFSFSAKELPSIKSMGAAPSRVASRLASRVKFPV